MALSSSSSEHVRYELITWKDDLRWGTAETGDPGVHTLPMPVVLSGNLIILLAFPWLFSLSTSRCTCRRKVR